MRRTCRPPWSIGLFTYKEMQAVLQWMLDTYYKHYKLYQYAFTNRYQVAYILWVLLS
jgi:hypothetical protein